MLSKCANPNCSEILRYLHQGKIFCLSPTPEVQSATGILSSALEERFWLCERCAKEMTLVWGGTQVKLVRLPSKVAALPLPHAARNEMRRTRPRARAVPADRDDR